LSIRDWLNRMFSPPGAIPSDARRLSALSEADLSSSLKALSVGERGWVALKEAAHLFSSKEPEYAFGETDEEGTHRLAAFAAACECHFEFMPMQERLYFIRNG
jgi:hypothetical protein